MLEKVLISFFQWCYQSPRLAEWVESCMKRLEGIKIIPDSKGFLKNLVRLLFFNRLSSVFAVFIGVVSARILGPAEFGRIGLVGNLTSFLFIPILMGANNSMYKFLPESTKAEGQKLMYNALLGNLVTTIFFGGLFFWLTGIITKSFHLSSEVWQMGLLFTVMITSSNLMESFLRGQKQYQTIAWLKFFTTGIFFLMIFLLFFGSTTIKANFITFYLCQIISLICFNILAFFKARVSFRRVNFSWKTLKQIYSLGMILMVNMFFTAILVSSDLFVVNYFYPGREVGIYNVYQGFGKNLFGVLFFEVFAVVFLPTIANLDKQLLYQKINKYLYWLLPGVAIFTGMMILLMVLLFGKEYPLNLTYLLMISLSIGFYFIFQIYNSIFSMEGNHGARLCLIPLGATIPLALLLQVCLTKFWGIAGTMLAVLLTNLILVCFFKVMLYYRYKDCH